MTSIRLTDEQLKQINEYPVNRSEFVRRAVDFYLLYLKNPYNDLLLNELEAWIQSKKNTKVVQTNTNVLNDNTIVTQNNTNRVQTNTNVLNDNTFVYENEYKKQNRITKSIEQTLQTELPTIHRLLNNPENNDSIPDYTLKMLSKKYALSKSSIEAWIAENREYLKHETFEEYS